MRRLAAVALLLAGIALPACAQRGGGHGGFSGGHSAGAFHGGGFSSAPSHFPGSGFSAPRYGGSPSFRLAPSYPRSGFASPRAGFGASNFRAPYSSSYARGGYNGSNRSRRVYVWRGGAWSSYVVPGWIGPGYLGYPYGWDYGDFGEDNTAPAGDSAAPAYDMPPSQQDEPEARQPYYVSVAPPSSDTAPRSEDAVTVVFKDGRPSEEIHNYALTRTTLYVMDDHHRDIPVNEIDLDATQRVNREAGVEFQLPVALQ
jgi:hypothetical protein